LILSILPVLALRYVNPPFTTMMVYSWLDNSDEGKSHMARHLWRPLKEISPHLRRAVLASEDQRFVAHHGFDFTEMNEALKDMFSSRGIRGASTITMQTARTVFLWPERSWLRKVVEAYYTLLIELMWSKERILEIYLNTVDWGEGIMGAEAASQGYFLVPPARITRSQAALLAAILPSPHTWSPTRPNAQVLRRQERILKDMENMPLGSVNK
jgi:monofunctional biosynthetic peptidoglycan transglycosylase